MKRKILFSLFLVFSIVSFGISQNVTYFEPQYEYYYGDINPTSSVIYKVYVPASEIGVLTLKSNVYGSELDLYAYSDPGLNKMIGKSNTRYTSKEIIQLPVEDYNRYVYVQIYNSGFGQSKYNIYSHNVDVASKFGEALIMAILEGIFSSDEMTESDKQDLSRALNIGASMIKGLNAENATRSFVLNELTLELRKELGYGDVANFFVNFVVITYDDILKNYWK